MERVVAHSDCNSFYASVEMLRNPRLRNVPMAVCGSTKERHGIVLTANYIAKRKGVRTAMANWEARRVCPGLYTVRPHYSDYVQFSGFAREIYSNYSDRVEAFGLDENWIDLTGCVASFEQGVKAVHEIRERVKRELGITVSIGLSDNKVFAKLGSDMKKPDACTAIPRGGYKEIVWPLPVGDLLYVGRATEAKLRSRFINTIGDLAKATPELLNIWFGKAGLVLYAFANGEDKSQVAPMVYEVKEKSIGNSHTCPRDLVCNADLKIMTYNLAEAVGGRLMDADMYASTVEIWYVNKGMTASYTRQAKLDRPTNISGEIADAAYKLFLKHYSHWPEPLRKIGVRAKDLAGREAPRQLSLWEDGPRTARDEALERTIHQLHARFGNKVIQRGIMYTDPELSRVDAKRDHTIHPVGVFNGGMSESWGNYTTMASTR